MSAPARLGGRAEEIGFAGSAGAWPAALAALLLAAMPVSMALANRSAPLVLALAAVAAMASQIGRARASAGANVLRDGPALTPLSVGIGAFVALGIASYGWSADRAQTLRALGEAAVPLIAGAVILRFLPRVAPRWTGFGLAIGVILGGLICIGELRLNMPIRNAFHLRAMEFEYNRPVLTLLALFWPLAALAVSARRGVALWLALISTTVAIWFSHSGTAMFAQVASVLAALLAWRFPRTALAVAALAVTIVFASIFAFGDVAWRVLPDATYDALAWAHAADRVEIWRSYGAAMLLHPLTGAGFGTSVTLGDTPIAGEVASEFRHMLAVGHPHNGYLQIGVELGMAGCILALATTLALLWSWRGLAGPALWARLGLFAMVAATMLVGHGAWQAWWIAVVFAGAGLVRTLLPRSDVPQGPQGAA